MIRTRWVKRDLEWIKNNPKSPTMYKEEYEDGISEVLDVDSSREKKVIIKKELVQYPKQEYYNKLKTDKGGDDAGIYVIICEPSKRAYVGQSVSMGNRMRAHKLEIVKELRSKNRVYNDMQEDKYEHGIIAFQFIKHVKMPYAKIIDLVNKEKQVMSEYSEMGYSLYNLEGCGNMYCNEEYKSVILKLIKRIEEDKELLNTIKALID